MKLLEIADEFENSEFVDNRERLQHLFKVQAARCREINIFILKLARQFPNWWEFEGKDHWGFVAGMDLTKDWIDTPGRQFERVPHRWSLPKSTNDDVSESDAADIASQFLTKYKAMISAKREYEQAGGNYRG